MFEMQKLFDSSTFKKHGAEISFSENLEKGPMTT